MDKRRIRCRCEYEIYMKVLGYSHRNKENRGDFKIISKSCSCTPCGVHELKYMEEHYGIILFFNWSIGCVG